MIRYDAIVEYRIKLTLKKNPFKNDYFKAGVCLFGLSCVLFALECTGMASSNTVFKFKLGFSFVLQFQIRE